MADTEPEAIYLTAEAVYLESMTRANIIYKKTLAESAAWTVYERPLDDVTMARAAYWQAEAEARVIRSIAWNRVSDDGKIVDAKVVFVEVCDEALVIRNKARSNAEAVFEKVVDKTEAVRNKAWVVRNKAWAKAEAVYYKVCDEAFVVYEKAFAKKNKGT